jgi:hypothetical protein
MRFLINHFVVKILFKNCSIAEECFNQFSLSDNFIATKVRPGLNFYLHYSKLHFQFNSFEIIKNSFKVFKYRWCFAVICYLN